MLGSHNARRPALRSQTPARSSPAPASEVKGEEGGERKGHSQESVVSLQVNPFRAFGRSCVCIVELSIYHCSPAVKKMSFGR